jgi:hypothetical protein
VAGGSLVGLPLGPPQVIDDEGTTVVPHEFGVVLAAADQMPEPLPSAVFDLWSSRLRAGASLGSPTAFAFPTDAGLVFSFQFGSITLNDTGVASLTQTGEASLTETELWQRYFLPEDDAQIQLRPMIGTIAAPLIGGAAALGAMRADIANASGPDDFIYLLSWHCNIDLELVAGDSSSTLRALLSRAAAGVQVRAMLWAGDPVSSPPTVVQLIGVSVPWQLQGNMPKTRLHAW